MYTLTIDPARKLCNVRCDGMLSPDEIARFYAEQRAGLTAAGCRPGDHLTLCDMRDFPIQTQESFARILKESGSAIGPRRAAMVTGTGPVRLQLRRLAKRGRIELFETIEAAEAWLFAEETRDAA